MAAAEQGMREEEEELRLKKEKGKKRYAQRVQSEARKRQSLSQGEACEAGLQQDSQEEEVSTDQVGQVDMAMEAAGKAVEGKESAKKVEKDKEEAEERRQVQVVLSSEAMTEEC